MKDRLGRDVPSDIPIDNPMAKSMNGNVEEIQMVLESKDHGGKQQQLCTHLLAVMSSLDNWQDDTHIPLSSITQHGKKPTTHIQWLVNIGTICYV